MRAVYTRLTNAISNNGNNVQTNALSQNANIQNVYHTVHHALDEQRPGGIV